MISGLLFMRLRAGCRAFIADARTYTPLSKSYHYPDVVVFCGPPTFHGPPTPTPSLTNPTLLIEALSRSTRNYDRSGKFMRYLSIESLQQYLMMDAHQMQAELYSRLPTGTWEYWHSNIPADVVDLKSVGCQITLAELYAQVDFDDPAANEEAG